jgi:hypothetical protein
MGRIIALMVAGGVCLFLAACSDAGPVAPPGVFFPTVPIEDAYPAAEIEGRLVVEDGCIYVTASDERWLLLWPDGYRASRDGRGGIQVTTDDGSLVGSEGASVRLGGGETRPDEVGGAAAAEAWASDLTGEQMPDRCGDLYWIVSPS